MLNLDTSTGIAFISEGSPIYAQLRLYVQGQQMVMAQTAFNEFISIVQTSLPFNRKITMQAQATIAPYLLSTYKLIERAFPEGVKEEDYRPLLVLLYEQMSDRNLAEVVAHYTGKDYHIVLNDVYGVQSMDVPISKVKERLLACGYDDWLQEE